MLDAMAIGKVGSLVGFPQRAARSQPLVAQVAIATRGTIMSGIEGRMPGFLPESNEEGKFCFLPDLPVPQNTFRWRETFCF